MDTCNKGLRRKKYDELEILSAGLAKFEPDKIGLERSASQLLI